MIQLSKILARTPREPYVASGVRDRTVADMICNGLVRRVPGNSAEIGPDLVLSGTKRRPIAPFRSGHFADVAGREAATLHG